MRKFYFLVLGFLFFSGLKAQIVDIPDVNFKARLLEASSTNTIAQNINGDNIKIDVNNDGEIEVSEALSVSILSISGTYILFSRRITDLSGISSFTNLISLDCSSNILYSLNVATLVNLAELHCGGNQFTSLNLAPLINLESLDCESGKLNFLDLTSLLQLTKLNCGSNKLTSLDVAPLVNLKELYCSYNKLNTIDVAPLVNLTELQCGGNLLTSLNVAPLVNLNFLNCSQNQITSLDIKSLVNLVKLECHINKLTYLDVAPLIKLNEFFCFGNQLTTLDISPLVNLTFLLCNQNQLTSLDVVPLVNLTTLDCSENQLTTLDVASLVNLKSLACNSNQLTSLNVTPLVNLNDLYCNYNKINSLDLSNLTNLQTLDIVGNNFTSFDIKNTKILVYDIEQTLVFSENINLQYICVNEKQLVFVQDLIDQYGYTNCHVNSYCSFVPGGEFYTIQGNTKLDTDNNGCDVADINYPNLKFSISDETNTGSAIANSTGSYSIPVLAGMHTITPVLENPSYFTVSPTNTVVTFPTQASPFTQDFCVTANGVHPDLEVTALPTTRARAGFDASYLIIYKNKGTQTQSGSVNLTFNDAVLDFVVANPIFSSQTVNNLSWSFTNLKPFETREITVTVNVNGPMETPAVNGGDTLDFTTTITSALTDETPTDNTFTLNQTVVNAFDPNDKTCLEGTTIAPSAVGKYVHYMIRFENKGTAEAENVVVKDMIDTSKFDISSLIVTQGSHPFVTKISETNKVEFIFEKINLPFDDATNDGYVAFKIKTLPSLVVGDSFSNTASIYFDYNFPIITNTATTSVLQNLGTPDFEFSTYFSVYPNPAKQVLNIDVKKEIALSSLSIFNTLGQQILVIPNAQKTKQVDVSNLKTGSYFIKVISNKGSASAKFVKE